MRKADRMRYVYILLDVSNDWAEEILDILSVHFTLSDAKKKAQEDIEERLTWSCKRYLVGGKRIMAWRALGCGYRIERRPII